MKIRLNHKTLLTFYLVDPCPTCTSRSRESNTIRKIWRLLLPLKVSTTSFQNKKYRHCWIISQEKAVLAVSWFEGRRPPRWCSHLYLNTSSCGTQSLNLKKIYGTLRARVVLRLHEFLLLLSWWILWRVRNSSCTIYLLSSNRIYCLPQNLLGQNKLHLFFSFKRKHPVINVNSLYTNTYPSNILNVKWMALLEN